MEEKRFCFIHKANYHFTMFADKQKLIYLSNSQKIARYYSVAPIVTSLVWAIKGLKIKTQWYRLIQEVFQREVLKVNSTTCPTVIKLNHWFAVSVGGTEPAAIFGKFPGHKHGKISALLGYKWFVTFLF